jgi:hypothetical protein
MIYDLYVPKLRSYYVVNTKTNILYNETFNLKTTLIINFCLYLLNFLTQIKFTIDLAA